MGRMRPPEVPEQPVPLILEGDLMKLMDACKGNTFENRRDTAILTRSEPKATSSLHEAPFVRVETLAAARDQTCPARHHHANTG
jgi:hypothetical protein